MEPGGRDPEVGAREAVVSCRWPLWPALVTSRPVSPSSDWLGVVVRTPTPCRPRGVTPPSSPGTTGVSCPGRAARSSRLRSGSRRTVAVRIATANAHQTRRRAGTTALRRRAGVGAIRAGTSFAARLLPSRTPCYGGPLRGRPACERRVNAARGDGSGRRCERVKREGRAPELIHRPWISVCVTPPP